MLGPYLLTELLLDRLRACAPARILFVTSGGMYTQRLAIDDLQSREGPFIGSAVYSRSKRAEMVLCEEWADRLRGSGIVVHAMHPGWSDSPGIRDALPGFSRADRADPAHARGGRRHARLARVGRRAGGDERAALARPAPASAPPARAHARERRRAPLAARTVCRARAGLAARHLRAVP